MKNLKFQSLHLLSQREKAARKVSFAPETSVIIGKNDTGKSSLIKSIYATFGANPSVVHPDWKGLGVTSLIQFDVDGTPYKLLRSSNVFALFDDTDTMLWSTSGITSGLAPLLADVLGIKLRMQSREGELIIPPPAYFFAPFYVDQDSGWQKNWSSFGNMQQFERARPSLALFHAGVRPNEYYAAQAEKIEADRAKSELTKEREALDRAASRLQGGRQILTLDLRPEQFGDRIEELTRRANILRARQEDVRGKLASLHSARAILVEQIDIAGAALAELDADFEFLRKSEDAEIPCPTCGTLHLNDFANKFSLIADADTCRAFVLEAKQDLLRVNKEIAAEKLQFGAFDSEISSLEEILTEAKGDVRLRDILESESERLVDEAFNKERGEIDASVGEKDNASLAAASVMKGYTDRKRDKIIKEFFGETLHRFALHLQVPTLPDSFFKSLYATPPETGSDLPRALLAYYYAYAHTVAKFSSAITAPLVIDSPVQQDQDPANAKRMIQFAVENVPSGMQLILGSVSLHGAQYSGTQLELKDERRLLRPEEYEDVRSSMTPLLNSLL